MPSSRHFAEFESHELELAGDLAFELGGYRLLGASDHELDTGRYLVVGKRQGEEWRCTGTRS